MDQHRIEERRLIETAASMIGLDEGVAIRLVVHGHVRGARRAGATWWLSPEALRAAAIARGVYNPVTTPEEVRA